MCGIVGQISHQTAENNDRLLLESIQALRHRGPDSSGHKTMNLSPWKIFLGHTRLSILDLSDRGRQPMEDDVDELVLSYNGEIYNYRELRFTLSKLGYEFQTETDTEVILKAWREWGPEAIPHLEGMFSFAIYSKNEKSIYIVRDAFGIKPLYYTSDVNQLIFGSELSALRIIMNRKPRLNHETAIRYLMTGSYDDGSSTFYEDIEQLLPGHYLKLDLSRMSLETRLERWWKPSIVEESIPFEEAMNRVRNLILQSVEMNVVSDVPVGVSFSGGLDSSVIVGSLRKLFPHERIRTFSFISEDPRHSEESWVDLMAQEAKLDHHKIFIAPEEFKRDIDSLIISQGEPFGSTSIYAQFRICQTAHEEGIKVLLEGQGGDEIFAGYHGYPHARAASLLSERRFLETSMLLNQWRKNRDQGNLRLLKIIRDVIGNEINQYALFRSGSITKENLSYGKFNTSIDNNRALGLIPRNRRLVGALRDEFLTGGMSRLLRHGDRNSMAWSVENRVPFLNKSLIQTSLSLPEHYLLSNGGETKYILRKAMKDIVPTTILTRNDKIGFETPEYIWMKSFHQNELLGWLEGLEGLDFVDTKSSRNFVKKSLSTKIFYKRKTWRILNFARWMQLVF
jgi:asparagine synthase (glutamine-hydrolysing)